MPWTAPAAKDQCRTPRPFSVPLARSPLSRSAPLRCWRGLCRRPKVGDAETGGLAESVRGEPGLPVSAHPAAWEQRKTKTNAMAVLRILALMDTSSANEIPLLSPHLHGVPTFNPIPSRQTRVTCTHSRRSNYAGAYRKQRGWTFELASTNARATETRSCRCRIFHLARTEIRVCHAAR